MHLLSRETLEYNRIKKEVERYAVSYAGRSLIRELAPMTEPTAVQRAVQETAEAKELLMRGSSVPIPSLEGIEWVMSLLGTGYLFNEQDFTAVSVFLNSCSQLRKYMASKDASLRIGAYAASLMELKTVKEEIERCIRFGVIDDGASKGLEKVRKRLRVTKERLLKKIESVMSRHQSILQESLYSMRGGRYVIPVKREYHKQVKGSVLDQSTSGQTVYVEPEEVAALQGELEMLTSEEAREEGIILSMLTGLIEREQEALKLNIEITGVYDFIFAKAKYAAQTGAQAVTFNNRGYMRLLGGKHPLLEGMIPIDVEFGLEYKSLVITGPNTGGKTVLLKTVGLLTLMAQSGLLIPADKESQLPVFSEVMSVIGDGQSLTQSLSTFSAQMKGVDDMLRAAGRNVLLLIDELAAGTDPGEGIALSIAILEELSRRGANVIVTTHFNELKVFASAAPDFQNARMEFDPVTLRPLYKLTIGEAGHSYALQIAEKLGLDAKVIERSRQIAASHPRKPLAEQEMRLWYDMEGRKEEKATAGSSAAKKEAKVHPEQPHVFEVGDAVYVTALGRTGIVYEKRDARGMVGVMVQKHKMQFNHKRLKPYLSKEELYPEDYDLDIVLETKENRKKRHLMERKHVEGLMIIKEKDEEEGS
ncbi:DNA mismatch repair protein MutS [Paenibacillus sp. 7124]|uniref:DNA mismatch repair protein MutS n=1 Tax=Paenibacillus apii TaxID=1850370 RepID=A0A6M1PFQ0_9BACL|nr:DNA mismatch repair protein MutS [Paenibacillus apii]NGM81956.1 DNA mismatch repair protein MutS [Paenibacillus apii]NJJ42054.1 DNA mismatch repair protein MutS [Paenibacillus apii]